MNAKASCNWKEQPDDPRVLVDLDPETPGMAEVFAKFLKDRFPAVKIWENNQGHLKMEISFHLPFSPPAEETGTEAEIDLFLHETEKAQ